MSRIACIDCKFCEYKPLSEEEKEEYYEADRKYYESIKGLTADCTVHMSMYRKNAYKRIRMQEYKCLQFRFNSFDILSGETSVTTGIDCETYRNEPFIGRCGHGAKFFQPKIKVIPIVSKPSIEPKKEQPQTVREYLKQLWKEIKEGI